MLIMVKKTIFKRINDDEWETSENLVEEEVAPKDEEVAGGLTPEEIAALKELAAIAPQLVELVKPAEEEPAMDSEEKEEKEEVIDTEEEKEEKKSAKDSVGSIERKAYDSIPNESNVQAEINLAFVNRIKGDR